MNNIHESQTIFFFQAVLSENWRWKYYKVLHLGFPLFSHHVKSYFSLVENMVTALFFSYNHIDFRWSAAEGQAGYSGMCEETLKTYDCTTELSYK